jgi:hypothetical protein
MRVLARKLLFVLPLASSLLLRAQFQNPTPEELKMTADPKAPGAAAVYLYIEQISDDQLHFKSYYARIKVLSEKGKEGATVEIPYERSNFKITDIKARTIHSDGAVIPLNVRPEDLVLVKTGEFQVNKKVFNLPSVEVGSILEFSYQIHFDDNIVSSPNWEVERPWFVHKAHYAFKPLAMYIDSRLQTGVAGFAIDRNGKAATFLLWNTFLPAGAAIKTDNFGHYILDVTDIPPIPQEEWMPPIDSLLYHVNFYYRDANDSAGFWQAEAKRWSKDVDHFAEPSRPIRDAVSGIIAPADGEMEKATKLYKAVQALDNTDFSRKRDAAELRELKLKPAKRAEDTWAQKSGSGNDLALLYIAMLRAAGLTAYAMKVVDRDRNVFDPTYLDANQLDAIIVILNIAGKEIPLDPGQKMCPFATLHWKHEGATGIRQGPSGSSAAGSPPDTYTANTVQRTGDLTVDAHGAVFGTFRFVMAGQYALHWRQEALSNDENEVKEQFNRWLKTMVPEGVDAQVNGFTALDNPDLSLTAMVTAKGDLGVATSRRLMLPGYFFETVNAHPFVDQATRLEPVDMHFGEVDSDQVAYHLPDGFTVEGAPQDARIPWTGYAVLVEKSRAGPGQITIARLFSRAFTLVKPEQYQDLRAFFQKVAAADQQQVVLSTSAPAKGN